MKVDYLGPYNEENIHPGFSVDCVILSFHENTIKVLLREFGLNQYWSLLGGFVYNNENADQAAYRVLESYTGVNTIFLKQFHLFSNPDRTSMAQNIDFVTQNATPENEGKWLLRRFITMGYYALVKYDEVALAEDKPYQLRWYDIHHLPTLYSDHEHIIKTALETIKTMFHTLPIAYELLPEKFTMTELRTIHEIILECKLDRRNFQRKMLSEGDIIQLKETRSEKSYNPPILYKYNPHKKTIQATHK